MESEESNTADVLKDEKDKAFSLTLSKVKRIQNAEQKVRAVVRCEIYKSLSTSKPDLKSSGHSSNALTVWRVPRSAVKLSKQSMTNIKCTMQGELPSQ